MSVYTINDTESGHYAQIELEKTKALLEAFSEKYPDVLNGWILDPRGTIDVAGIKHNKAFFLAEFKHYEADRPSKIRVKWGELLASKVAGIPIIAFIQIKGQDMIFYLSPQAIPYSIEELEQESHKLTKSGKQRRLTINIFETKVGSRRVTGRGSIVPESQAIELLKREVDNLEK